MKQTLPGLSSPRRGMHGFTLIELMIVVVVIAVLSMVALPAYMDSVRKSRRSEAVSALSAVQQAQERWRANCPQYAASATLPPVAGTCSGAVGLGQPATTVSGRYAIAISGAPTATAYTVTATAVAGKGQDKDKALGVMCSSLTLAVSAGTWSATPTQCWSR